MLSVLRLIPRFNTKWKKWRSYQKVTDITVIFSEERCINMNNLILRRE